MRHGSSSSDRLAIATGIPTAPCSTPYGDLMIRLAVQNRQDYVRLHGHELYLMAQSVDPHLMVGAWQKLGFMQQVILRHESLSAKCSRSFIKVDGSLACMHSSRGVASF